MKTNQFNIMTLVIGFSLMLAACNATNNGGAGSAGSPEAENKKTAATCDDLSAQISHMNGARTNEVAQALAKANDVRAQRSAEQIVNCLDNTLSIHCGPGGACQIETKRGN